jgi:hypothetical protein
MPTDKNQPPSQAGSIFRRGVAPITSEQSDDGFPKVLRKRARKETLAAMVKGKRQKDDKFKQNLYPLTLIL